MRRFKQGLMALVDKAIIIALLSVWGLMIYYLPDRDNLARKVGMLSTDKITTVSPPNPELLPGEIR